MLALVSQILPLIPLKPDVSHATIVITYPTLRNNSENDTEGQLRCVELEQNPHNCTQRQRCQTGFFIKKNPTAQMQARYTYADSALTQPNDNSLNIRSVTAVTQAKGAPRCAPKMYESHSHNRTCLSLSLVSSPYPPLTHAACRYLIRVDHHLIENHMPSDPLNRAI